MESVGEKAHGQKLNDNRQRKLLSLKSLNRRLMPDISFTVCGRTLLAISLHFPVTGNDWFVCYFQPAQYDCTKT